MIRRGRSRNPRPSRPGRTSSRGWQPREPVSQLGHRHRNGDCADTFRKLPARARHRTAKRREPAGLRAFVFVPAMVHPGLGPVIDPSIKACCKRKGGHSKSAVRARRCHLAAPASSVDQRTARRRRSSRQTAGEGGCSRRRLSPRLRSGGDGRTVHAYSTRRADNRQRCRASPTSRPSSIRASPFKSSRTT